MKHLDGAICLFTIAAILTLVLVISFSLGDAMQRSASLDTASSNQTVGFRGEELASR